VDINKNGLEEEVFPPINVASSVAIDTNSHPRIAQEYSSMGKKAVNS
jgi:hypothetical protein